MNTVNSLVCYFFEDKHILIKYDEIPGLSDLIVYVMLHLYWVTLYCLLVEILKTLPMKKCVAKLLSPTTKEFNLI